MMIEETIGIITNSGVTEILRDKLFEIWNV